MKTYDNTKTLKGLWVITRKIDGVQVVVEGNGPPVSRKGKPLYGLPELIPGRYEVFINNWEETVSHVRSHNSTACSIDYLYRLSPTVDKRLIIIKEIINPSHDFINSLFIQEIENGNEGLVLLGTNGEELKVKAKSSYDVEITEIIEGKGKFVGMMGALQTDKGKVGTGFNNQDRLSKWDIGETIEVECMGLTPSGKFRHPRFVRRRFDK